MMGGRVSQAQAKLGALGVLKALPHGGLLLLVSRTGLACLSLQPPEK